MTLHEYQDILCEKKNDIIQKPEWSKLPGGLYFQVDSRFASTFRSQMNQKMLFAGALDMSYIQTRWFGNYYRHVPTIYSQPSILNYKFLENFQIDKWLCVEESHNMGTKKNHCSFVTFNMDSILCINDEYENTNFLRNEN